MKPYVHVFIAFVAAVTLISMWSFQIRRRLKRVMTQLQREVGRRA